MDPLDLAHPPGAFSGTPGCDCVVAGNAPFQELRTRVLRFFQWVRTEILSSLKPSKHYSALYLKGKFLGSIV